LEMRHTFSFSCSPLINKSGECEIHTLRYKPFQNNETITSYLQ
jgi:hypothetical protein